MADQGYLSVPDGRAPVAVAIPMGGQQMKFVPRRRDPVGQRFEFARFLGEYLRLPKDRKGWLDSTDLATSRQKYQPAFAAELLCPLDSLTSFLDGDSSSYAIDEAADRFEVSEQVVTNLLLNNGYIHHHWSRDLPYPVAAWEHLAFRCLSAHRPSADFLPSMFLGSRRLLASGDPSSGTARG
jgi:hypothetical protein